MKRVQKILVALVTCAVCAPALANDDVQAIQALYQDYREAVEASSIDGYIAILDDEVRMLPPGAPAIQGAAAYRDFLAPVFATATYEIEIIEPPRVDLVGEGVAVSEYVYIVVLTLKDEDVGISEPGALTENRTTSRYFDVLRRNEDGAWRVWRHSWQTLPE